jgi:DNA (cytosine-5)-methyltransferase 1
MQGGWRQPCIITAAAMRGRYNEDKVEQHIEVSDREYANAITTVQKDSLINCDYRIRKLTPKECWRLMGFDDEDFEKASKVCSNSQLYKQAGNSIVVNVLVEIFTKLLN